MTTTLHRSRGKWALALLVVVAAPVPGCYKKVVRAEGWGALEHRVEQPDAPTEAELAAKKARDRQKSQSPPGSSP